MSMRLKTLIFAVSLLFSLSSLWAVNVPLANNGFETSWTGTTTAPPGWTRSSTSTSFTTARNTTYKASGTASVALGRTTSTSFYIYQEMAATASTAYTFSGKFLDNGNSKVRLYVNFYNGSTAVGTAVYSTYTANSASWQTRSVSFTTPATANKIRLEIRSYDDPTGYRGPTYVDDILLDRAGDTTAPVVSALTFIGNNGGNKVGGKVQFTAVASDNTGVSKVMFYKGTTLLATDTTAPYQCLVDFNNDAANADYVIKAVAYDAANNTAFRTVTVNKPNWNMRGSGATLAENGCFFRVWAPHASEVQLVGNFNSVYSNGALGAHFLTKGTDNYWFGFVPGAVAGNRYKYALWNPGGTDNAYGRHYRLDPLGKDSDHSYIGSTAAEKASLSYNASIVVDPTFTWAAFTPPSKNDYIIYQLHVGSYAGWNDGIPLSGTIARFSDIVTKLQYIKDMGFNAIEFLPVCEFSGDRSWGYNIALYNTPEAAYGSPAELRTLVNEAHKKGIAIIFDVVYNHDGPQDSSTYEFDGYYRDGGIYREGGWDTQWGRGPAWWKQEVQDFFFENAKMFIEEYKADGLRFDHTASIDGNKLKEVLWRIKSAYPNVYTIAEHGDGSPWITTTGNFDATWTGSVHHEFQRACNGQDSVNKIEAILGWSGYAHPWNLVKYLTGCHDDIGDQGNGNAEDGLTNWDKRHRYFSDLFGGRDNWHARAKSRLGWALNVTMPGTPMLFMGTEWHFNPPWGYWHDGSDLNGDHRINWATAFDATGVAMRNLVSAANAIRWQNQALRSDTLRVTQKDVGNNVIAFKRWDGSNVVLTVVNMSDKNWLSTENGRYGISTDGQAGQWVQILCSQDAAFGGWDGAGNAYHEPWTTSGKISINLPKWSVVVFKLKT